MAPLDVASQTNDLPAIEVAVVAADARPDGAWAPAKQPVSRGFHDDAVWFRVTLRNPTVTQTPQRAWGPFEERTFKGIVRPQKVAELDPAATRATTRR